MPFNPTSLSFSYRKYSGVLPNANLELSSAFGIDNNSISIDSHPSWLQVVTSGYEYPDGDINNGDANDYKKAFFKVGVSEQANNLPLGYHRGIIEISYRYATFSAKKTEKLEVTIRVIENEPLSLSKKDFNFSYTIGDAPPDGQFLTITSGSNWSITADQPWLTFSAGNGSGYTVVTLNVNVANLPVGLHSAKFIVDDGTTQVIGNVFLNITGTGNAEDYLNVHPGVLEFSETLQAPPEKTANIKIDTSLPAVITANVAWLQFSLNEVPAGLTAVDVNTVNTELLAVGSYPAEIKITSSYGVSVINVLLQIVEILTIGIENNGFYFAEDRNTLFLTTGNLNAAAVLDFQTHATLELKNYRYTVPFYRNSASKVIGLETALLLHPFNLPEALDTQAYVPVKPIMMNFTVYDKALGSAAMVERQKFQNLQFLPGKSPARENILSYIPSRLTVPKDGIVAFSFMSKEGIATIEITGAAVSSIPVAALGSDIYGIFINLATLNLSPGDEIKIVCGPVTVDVQIKPTDLPTMQLIWLNEWECPEVMNLDGEFEMIYEDDSTTVVTSRSGKTYSSIVDVKDAKAWKVDTGQIYSDAEVKHLASIIRSKKMWLQLPDERIEVIRTFRNLSVLKTRRFENEFSLTFDAAEK